jgi:hypothetical protein
VLAAELDMARDIAREELSTAVVEEAVNAGTP